MIFSSSTPQPPTSRPCYYHKSHYLQDFQFKYYPFRLQPVVLSSFCYRVLFYNSPAICRPIHWPTLSHHLLASSPFSFSSFLTPSFPSPFTYNLTSSPTNFISKLYSFIFYLPLYPQFLSHDIDLILCAE